MNTDVYVRHNIKTLRLSTELSAQKGINSKHYAFYALIAWGFQKTFLGSTSFLIPASFWTKLSP